MSVFKFLTFSFFVCLYMITPNQQQYEIANIEMKTHHDIRVFSDSLTQLTVAFLSI